MSPTAAARALLRGSLRGRGRVLILLVLWSAVEALPALLSGRLIAHAVDHGFLAHDIGRGFLDLGLLALAVVAGAEGTRRSFGCLAAVIEPFRDVLVRRAVTGTLWRSAATGAAPDGAGVARVTQQVEIVREAYGSVLMVAQTFAVTAVAALIGLSSLLPAAVPLVVGPLAVALVVFAALLGRLATRQTASILADEHVAGSAASVIGGLRDVVASGGEDVAAAAVGRHVREQATATSRLARMAAIRTLVVALGGLLPVVLILLSGDRLARDGASTGAILGALTYVLRGVQPALQTFVGGIGSTGLWLMVTLRRLAETAPDPPPAASEVPPGAPRGEVRLSDASFAYAPTADPVFARLDLAIAPGDHLAIVGPSGAGKSTLACVIAGLLAPTAGAAELDGVPAAAIAPDALAERRVLLPENAYVFGGTVRANLTYLAPDATTAAVEEAVRLLGADALVARLGGLDAALRPERLSGGERQLLALVRGYLSPAPLVLLDEAGSYLDAAGEARVEAAFAARPGALVVIAHRISSALRAQRVLVMDGPSITVGTHDELLTRSPLYRDLVGGWGGPPGPAVRSGPCASSSPAAPSNTPAA